MKLKWSTGIVIAIITFIGFIMVMVITMVTDAKYNHDLVTERYYQKELAYQQNINAITNIKKLKKNIKIKKVNKGLRIFFPENFIPKNIKGKVFLYRPSNKELDMEIPLSLTDHSLLVPDFNLLGGRWNISIDFTYKGVAYLFEKNITY